MKTLLPSFSLSARIFGLLLVVAAASSCSKINICGQESKLYGTWVITEFTIADSVVSLVDPTLVPPDFPAGLPVFPLLAFQESGALFYIQYQDTTFSSYRVDRYEQKCLIYSDLFEYRLVITKLSKSTMDIESWYLVGPDSLLTTTLSLEKL
jgi:hypothetical protein